MKLAPGLAPGLLFALLLAGGAGCNGCSSSPADPWTWPRPPHGVELRYQLSGVATMDARPGALFDSGDAAGAPLAAEVTIEGVWSQVELREEPERTVSAVRLEQARILVAAEQGTGSEDSMERALSRWTLVVHAPSGEILEVVPPADQPASATALVKALLAEVQLTRGRGSREWTAQELDPSGRYEARYELEEAGRTLRLQKTRVRYLPRPVRPGEVGDVHTLEPTGGARAVIDRSSGVVTSFAFEGRLDTSVTGRHVGHTRTRLRLRLLGKRPLQGPDDEALREALARVDEGARGTPLFDGSSDPTLDEAFHREMLGEETETTLVAQLRGGVADHSEEALTKLSLAVAGLLHFHPSSAAALVDAAEEDDATRLLADVLVRSPHESARRALVGLVRKKRSRPELLMSLVPVLGRMPNPSPEAVDELESLAEDTDETIAGMARLALGVAARGLVDTAPERAAELARWMETALDEARESPEQLAHWLRVAGNAGPAVPIERVLAHTEDPRLPVRAAAYRALRFHDLSESFQWLDEAVRSEPEPEVRIAALSAFSVQSIETGGAVLDTVAHALLEDPAPDVRITAVRVLVPWRAGVPEVDGLLHRVAQTDADEEVREAARRALEEKASTP